MAYPCHNEHVPKLNRIEGQVRAVKKMIHEERYCVDILMQIKAIRGALMRVQKEILHTHMKTCVTDTITNKDTAGTKQKIQEILTLMGD